MLAQGVAHIGGECPGHQLVSLTFLSAASIELVLEAAQCRLQVLHVIFQLVHSAGG